MKYILTAAARVEDAQARQVQYELQIARLHLELDLEHRAAMQPDAAAARSALRGFAYGRDIVLVRPSYVRRACMPLSLRLNAFSVWAVTPTNPPNP